MSQIAPVKHDVVEVEKGEVENNLIDLHDPNLYQLRAIINAIPGGIDALTEQHIAIYKEFGFLAVNDVFTPIEVDAGLAGMVHLIMGGNPEFKGVQFEAAVKSKLHTLSATERQDAVRKLMWFVKFDPRLNAMAYHPKLIGFLTKLLGSEPTMFQDMGLMKPPRIGREKPWHQDKAYFNIDPREKVVGCWVALDEATVENGCMHLLPEIPLKPIVHFKRRDWQICDTEILGKQCVAAPLKPGGVLFFDGLLVHGTPHNNSIHRRRAVQFHYHGNKYPRTSNEERLALFGSEGKDVQC
jgi:phytanoyl-CoA hydroxylase